MCNGSVHITNQMAGIYQASFTTEKNNMELATLTKSFQDVLKFKFGIQFFFRIKTENNNMHLLIMYYHMFSTVRIMLFFSN